MDSRLTHFYSLAAITVSALLGLLAMPGGASAHEKYDSHLSYERHDTHYSESWRDNNDAYHTDEMKNEDKEYKRDSHKREYSQKYYEAKYDSEDSHSEQDESYQKNHTSSSYDDRSKHEEKKSDYSMKTKYDKNYDEKHDKSKEYDNNYDHSPDHKKHEVTVKKDEESKKYFDVKKHSDNSKTSHKAYKADAGYNSEHDKISHHSAQYDKKDNCNDLDVHGNKPDASYHDKTGYDKNVHTYHKDKYGYKTAHHSNHYKHDKHSRYIVFASYSMPDQHGQNKGNNYGHWGENGIDDLRSDEMRLKLQSVLQEHAALVMPALKAEIKQTPDRDAAMQAVEMNNEAIVSNVESRFSGTKDEFRDLWESHVGYYIEAAQGMRDDDHQKVTSAREKLATFADDAGGWFASRDDSYDVEELSDMFAMHGEQTLALIGHIARDEHAQAYSVGHEAYIHMAKIAEYLAKSDKDNSWDKHSDNMQYRSM